MSLGVPTVHHQVILLTFLVSLINKKFRNERGFTRSLIIMDSTKKIQYINSFALGAILAVIFIAIATIGGELHSPFKQWLKLTFFHHWIGKGVLSLIIFFAIGLFARGLMSNKQSVTHFLLVCLSWVIVLSMFSIFGFYFYEVFFAVH